MFLNLLAESTTVGSLILPFILIGVLVLFFIMSSRSNKKKKQEAAEMMAKFRKGCHVKTIGGIMGKVVAINDTEGTFILETGSNKQKCLIKFDKQAIYQVAEGKKAPNKAVEDEHYAEEVEEVAEPAQEVVAETVATEEVSTEE